VSESVITRRLITLDQLMAGMDIPRARADWWDDPLNEAMVLWRIDRYAPGHGGLPRQRRS